MREKIEMFVEEELIKDENTKSFCLSEGEYYISVPPNQEFYVNIVDSDQYQYDGDKKMAASILGISLKTLYNRINDYEEK